MKETINQLGLDRHNQKVKTGLAIITSASSNDATTLLPSLSKQEKSVYASFPSKKRQLTYLMGRHCAKKAINQLHSKITPSDITIESGCFDQPIVIHSDIQNTQISIAHSQHSAIAIAFPEHHPMGVDIETLDEDRLKIINTQLTESEKRLCVTPSVSELMLKTVLWTAKESLSKTIKTGLMTPPSIYEINTVTRNEDEFEITFKHFGQYKGVAVSFGGNVICVCMPKESRAQLEKLLNAK